MPIDSAAGLKALRKPGKSQRVAAADASEDKIVWAPAVEASGKVVEEESRNRR